MAVLFHTYDRQISKIVSHLIKSKSNKHPQIHNVTRYSVSVDNYLFLIVLFIYTLVCRRRDFTFVKRETKLINTFKIQLINGIANLQMLMVMKHELRFTNIQCLQNLILTKNQNTVVVVTYLLFA